MLKDSSKAVLATKKGNIPFGKADLAAIVLVSVPMSWQNQYNLNQSTVLESTCTLLPDLEAIECIMVEKHNKKLKAKVKASTAWSEAKSNPKRKASGSPTGWVPKSGCSEKFCQRCKAHGGSYQTHNTLDCVAMTAMVSPSRQQQVSPLSPRSHTRRLGAIRAWPSCRPCLRLMQRSRRKPVSLEAQEAGLWLQWQFRQWIGNWLWQHGNWCRQAS